MKLLKHRHLCRLYVIWGLGGHEKQWSKSFHFYYSYGMRLFVGNLH